MYNPQNEMFREIKTKRFGIKTRRMLFEHRSNSVRMQQSGVKKEGDDNAFSFFWPINADRFISQITRASNLP